MPNLPTHEQIVAARVERVVAVAPFFDKITATGYLPSLFSSPLIPRAVPKDRSVGDVLRAQYGAFGSKVTFDIETFERIAEAIRELEGALAQNALVEVPDDVAIMQETERAALQDA